MTMQKLKRLFIKQIPGSPQLNKKLHNTENIKIVKKPQIIFKQV